MAKQQLTIVLTGGGSGGHITPIQAVAAELKRLHPAVRTIYIGQKGDGLQDIPANDANIDEVYTIRAGKFRRYHGEGWRQLLDIPTMVKNARDVLYVLIGLGQSYQLLKRLQPDVIFIKGGFVGVPVGLAAAKLHLPYVTHDSDALPGLANRIIARWATKHAVALPVEVYNYPAAKTVQTGIPLQADFQAVTPELKQRYRKELDLKPAAKLLFIIGGGLGAERVNGAVAEVVPHLLHEYPDLQVVHGVGRLHETTMQARYEAELEPKQQGRVQVVGYVPDVYRYSGAADLVITRAGATNLAEFAVQGKACIVVPNPLLTGGHQLKNAEYLANQHAAVILSEADLTADPNRLAKLVSDLLPAEQRLQALGKALQTFAMPDATHRLAALLLRQAKHRGSQHAETRS